MMRTDSWLRVDELEPGDGINLIALGWALVDTLPRVWNWSKSGEHYRARRTLATVTKVIHTRDNTYLRFENFPDWIAPNETVVPVRTHDHGKETA